MTNRKKLHLVKEDVSYVFFSNENCLYGTKLGLLVKLKESVLVFEVNPES